VYWWADGLYFNVRLQQDRPCVLVRYCQLGEFSESDRPGNASYQFIERKITEKAAQVDNTFTP